MQKLTDRFYLDEMLGDISDMLITNGPVSRLYLNGTGN